MLAVCDIVIQEDLVQVFVYLEFTALCALFEEEVRRNKDEAMDFVRTNVGLVPLVEREFVVKLFWMVNEGTAKELGETVMAAA